MKKESRVILSEIKRYFREGVIKTTSDFKGRGVYTNYDRVKRLERDGEILVFKIPISRQGCFGERQPLYRTWIVPKGAPNGLAAALTIQCFIDRIGTGDILAASDAALFVYGEAGYSNRYALVNKISPFGFRFGKKFSIPLFFAKSSLEKYKLEIEEET